MTRPKATQRSIDGQSIFFWIEIPVSDLVRMDQVYDSFYRRSWIHQSRNPFHQIYLDTASLVANKLELPNGGSSSVAAIETLFSQKITSHHILSSGGFSLSRSISFSDSFELFNNYWMNLKQELTVQDT